jgi:hypothetical protein
MGANSIYVAPMQPIEMALDLSRVGCEGFFGTENCSPEATAQSQYITLALGIGALIGGIAGLLGGIDIWKGKKIGYKIWAVLVLISILTVIWNWVWASAMYSSIWALLYLLSFIAVWKVKQNETI